MDVPVHRRARFGALRERLLADLERWPELVEDAGRESVPRTEVEETDTAWLVDVDLPGVLPGDVSVELAQGELVVSGRRRSRFGRTDGRSGAQGVGRVVLTLPTDADVDQVTAVLELGVLSVVVPKRAPDGPRRIPVRRPSAG